MRRKKWALYTAAALLCLPIAYLAVRDAVVFAAFATNTLAYHDRVQYELRTEKDLTEGEDEGRTACSVVVHEPWRRATVTYPISCDAHFSGAGKAGVVPGIFSDEVVVLDGAVIWHGEPGGQLYFLPAVLYAISYFTVLYVLSLWYLNRQPNARRHPSLRGIALGPAFAGLMACYAALMLVVPLFNGDPMLAMALGAALALYLGRRIERGSRPPVTSAE